MNRKPGKPPIVAVCDICAQRFPSFYSAKLHAKSVECKPKEERAYANAVQRP